VDRKVLPALLLEVRTPVLMAVVTAVTATLILVMVTAVPVAALLVILAMVVTVHIRTRGLQTVLVGVVAVARVTLAVAAVSAFLAKAQMVQNAVLGRGVVAAQMAPRLRAELMVAERLTAVLVGVVRCVLFGPAQLARSLQQIQVTSNA
jgi:hypothetical protein